MIGPGKAFDTDRFFVVSTNLLGGCRGTTGPSSIDPATGRPYGSDFPGHHRGRHGARRARPPRRARHRPPGRGGRRVARRHAGVRVGDPLSRPGRCDRRHRQHARVAAAGRRLERHRPQRDHGRPDWQGGHYYGTGRKPDAGMGVARMVGHITYLSAQSLGDKFGRRLQFADDIRYTVTEPEFEVENYLRHQAERLRQALRRQHLSLHVAGAHLLRPRPPVRQAAASPQALRDVRARTLLIAFSSDWLYPPIGSEELADGAARARQGCRAARHRRALRPRLLPAGRSAPDADDSAVPRRSQPI